MSRFSGKPGAFAMMEEEARRSGADLGAKVHANMQRVKVHSLTDDGHWDDLGTGHVTIDKIEGSRETALAVVNEKDNDTLLLHKITSDDIYKKQDTIILWKDPEKAREIALSFQEAEGCTHIWENMLSVQKQLQSGSLGHESIASDELKGLPLELSSLPLLLKTVLEWGAKDQLRIAELISQDQIELQ